MTVLKGGGGVCQTRKNITLFMDDPVERHWTKIYCDFSDKSTVIVVVAKCLGLPWTVVHKVNMWDSENYENWTEVRHFNLWHAVYMIKLYFFTEWRYIAISSFTLVSVFEWEEPFELFSFLEWPWLPMSKSKCVSEQQIICTLSNSFLFLS